MKEALIVAEQVKKEEHAHILKTQRALAFSKGASLRRALVLWRKNTQLAKEEAAFHFSSLQLKVMQMKEQEDTGAFPYNP